jgi:Fe-S-cluster containining protein
MKKDRACMSRMFVEKNLSSMKRTNYFMGYKWGQKGDGMSNFTCRRCGRCCGLAPFSKADYKAVFRIAKNMGITFVKMRLQNTVYYLPRSTAKILVSNHPERIIEGEVDITCPFMGMDKQQAFCRIYDKRPEVCRLFGVNTEKHRYLQCPHQEG